MNRFAEMVQAGRFPKRSAAFYPDGRLRHVGFLGAMPPAVKGLKNISFGNDDDAIAFEFDQPLKEESSMKFAEFFEVFKIWKKFEKDPDAVHRYGWRQRRPLLRSRRRGGQKRPLRKRQKPGSGQNSQKRRRPMPKNSATNRWPTGLKARWLPASFPPPSVMAAWSPSCRACPMSRLPLPKARKKNPAWNGSRILSAPWARARCSPRSPPRMRPASRKSEADAEYALGKDIGERANR